MGFQPVIPPRYTGWKPMPQFAVPKILICKKHQITAFLGVSPCIQSVEETKFAEGR
jgi:hypothetical protein